MRRQRGFTLVELMVVVAIIAIIGALIVGISSRTYGVNASNMSQQLVQTLTFTRQRALSTRRIHRVEIHFDASPIEILVWQAGVTGMNRSNISVTPRLVERTIIPNSITLKGAATGANPSGTTVPTTTTQFDIDFLPNGSADVVGGSSSTDSATLWLTDSSGIREHRVLVYSATGSSYARKSW